MPGSKSKSNAMGGFEKMFIARPHGVVVFAARWGQLLGLLMAWAVLVGYLWLVFGLYRALVLILAPVALVGWIAPVRRMIQRRAWCVITRNRLYTVFVEIRAHTRNGRLPIIVRVRPTVVGEKVTVWCLAGVALDDFEDQTRRIAAACYARDSRVSASPKRAHLLTFEIIRRDTLAASAAITPNLIGAADRARVGLTDTLSDALSDAVSSTVRDAVTVPAQRADSTIS